MCTHGMIVRPKIYGLASTTHPLFSENQYKENVGFEKNKL